jgi:mRNA-degrading endonuclease YafQ of YafQ-DinJ toxin-antitoxin module
MEILYSAKFIKQYSKLSSEIKKDFEVKESFFKNDNFDTRLKTHKLHGRFEGFLSFSVNYKYRIVFEYINDKKYVRFHAIGNHDIYE